MTSTRSLGPLPSAPDSSASHTTHGKSPRIAIIGAGMSGMLMAIKLKQAGFDQFTIYEKASKLGGTWRDNTYPGLQCDVPAHMYTFSFEPNAEYSNRFAKGSEIQQYLERVADKYDIPSSIQFNSPVTSARFESGKWILEMGDGSLVTADIVVCASGVLHQPSYPEIEGIKTFQGTQFHTARWDHSQSLAGKRVGVIGSGSTAAQVVPAITPIVQQMVLFQRTPQWIFPMPNKDYSESDKDRIRKNPLYGKYLRYIYSKIFQWTFARAVIGNKLLLKLIQWQCETHLNRKVKDPALREKLLPKFKAGCKRLIFAKGFYQALQRPNASLVTESISRITPTGIETADGEKHNLDVIIYATGFQAHNYMRPMKVYGKDGLSIDQAWKSSAFAHRSVSVPNFPNFFMIFGPYSPIGNYSAISVAEVQVNYLVQLMKTIQSGVCDLISPKVEATQERCCAMKTALQSTVWLSGCNSWYLDGSGVPTMWPWTFERYAKEMKRVNLAEFHLETIPSKVKHEQQLAESQSIAYRHNVPVPQSSNNDCDQAVQ